MTAQLCVGSENALLGTGHNVEVEVVLDKVLGDRTLKLG